MPALYAGKIGISTCRAKLSLVEKAKFKSTVFLLNFRVFFFLDFHDKTKGCGLALPGNIQKCKLLWVF